MSAAEPIETVDAAPTGPPLLHVSDVARHFPIRRGPLRRVVGHVRAVDGVSLDVLPGQTVGLVGESGSGKSTLARLILGLQPVQRGSVVFDGTEITALDRNQLRSLRQRMQMVFQDPYSSLNPRMTVGRMITEAMEVHGIGDRVSRQRRATDLLEMVGLPAAAAARYPHEFSGGQRQRVGIARALAPGPAMIIADEALSALDVSVQAQIVNLLLELRTELGLAFLFISHDLSMVRFLCDRVVVLYLGRVVEEGPVDQIYRSPAHPYTRTLLAAAPKPDPDHRRPPVTGADETPDPARPPSGCSFHPRCPLATEICRETAPVLSMRGGQAVACHHAE